MTAFFCKEKMFNNNCEVSAQDDDVFVKIKDERSQHSDKRKRNDQILAWKKSLPGSLQQLKPGFRSNSRGKPVSHIREKPIKRGESRQKQVGILNFFKHAREPDKGKFDHTQEKHVFNPPYKNKKICNNGKSL